MWIEGVSPTEATGELKELYVELRRRQPRDVILDPALTEGRTECLACVAISDDPGHAVVAQHTHESIDRLDGIEGRTLPLIRQVVENYASVVVPMPNGEHSIIVGATGHIQEG